MAGRNHQVHSEERGKEKLVEFSSAHFHILAVSPLKRLHKHYEHTYIEDAFQSERYRIAYIHTSETFLRQTAGEADSHCAESEQDRGKHSVSLARAFRCKCIEQEDEYEDSEHYQLRNHS